MTLLLLAAPWVYLTQRAVVAVALLGASCLASLVNAQTVNPEPSAALGCLQLDPAQPQELEYPFNPFKRGEAGRVQVQLEFTTPTGRPKVKVLQAEGEGAAETQSEFVAAVRGYVQHLRLPCLVESDGPVQLRQDYVFKPALKSAIWTTEDPEDQARAEQAGCVKHPHAKTPDYPVHALNQGLVGRIFATMRFTGADAAPEIKIWAREPSGSLALSVREFANGLRMPCYAGRPVITNFEFVFKFEGEGSEYGFKPMTLQSYLGSVKGIFQQTLSFDFRQMSCPFVVQLRYLRPASANRVEEQGAAVIQRKPFLDWLRQTELDLPRRTLDSVYADTALISVPCGKLELAPKVPS